MARPIDCDSELASLNSELRAVMEALNAECHPVQTPQPDRVAALEAQVAELKAEILHRRSLVQNDQPLNVNRRDADA